MAPTVSAVIVTRGDVDTEEILRSLEPVVDEIVVWDNGQDPVWPRTASVWKWREEDHQTTVAGPEITNVGVYGRYAAIAECRNDVIYVQDDDCLVDAAAVIAAYEPGRLVANMLRNRWADYPDSVMVGWGAVFDRDLPAKAFGGPWQDPAILGRQLFDGEGPDFFNRCCDVVFSALTPRTVIDVGVEHLPWAHAPGRMWTSDPATHNAERGRMLALARRVRTWPDDDRRC